MYPLWEVSFMPIPCPSRNTIQINISILKEARAYLDSLVNHPRGHGQLISQLILAEKARREERERIAQELVQAGGLR
jgi:hypothetical protein